MLVGADLPAEFHGPVSYFDRWLWFALLAVLVVIAYYVAVWWLTRDRPVAAEAPPPDTGTDPRSQHLAAIDRIEAEARAGDIALRTAHQQLSETVRSYVDLVTHLPARTMSLADFRSAAPGQLADTIALLYPPEFAPGEEGQARERFDAALLHARRLVSTWR